MSRKQRSAELNRRRKTLGRNWRWIMVYGHRCRCADCAQVGAA